MNIVYYNGSGLLMDSAAMVELGWRNGQHITEAQMWEGIAANARAFCRDIDARKAAGEDVPDISNLAASCSHNGTQ